MTESAAVPVATREAQIALAQAYAVFPEGRWRDAGADDGDIALLRETWDAHDVEWQGEEGRRVASVDLGTLAAELDAFVASDPAAALADASPYAGSIEAVKEVVGDDPVKAAEALEYERAHQNRGRLVKHLEGVAEPVATDGHLGGAAEDLGGP